MHKPNTITTGRIFRHGLQALALALAALAAGCGQATADGDKPVLSVSIEPQRRILEELAGDRYTVNCVLAKGANPESFDPSMAQRADLNRSRAFFVTGYLPYEQNLSQTLDDGVAVFNTSAGITPVTGTHSHGAGTVHTDEDPHVWASLRNGKVMAANMRDALKQIDPDHAPEYDSRYQTIARRLDSLDAVAAESLRRSGVHAFAVWHPSLSYYARDYGLHQIAVGQESKEVSVGILRSVIDEAREDSVRVFFYQQEYDSRQASNINEEVGSRLVPLNPVAYDWEDELMKVTYELSR